MQKEEETKGWRHDKAERRERAMSDKAAERYVMIEGWKEEEEGEEVRIDGDSSIMQKGQGKVHLCGQDLRRGLQFVSVCMRVSEKTCTRCISEHTRACLSRFLFLLTVSVCARTQVLFEQETICTRRHQKPNMLIFDCLQVFLCVRMLTVTAVTCIISVNVSVRALFLLYDCAPMLCDLTSLQ